MATGNFFKEWRKYVFYAENLFEGFTNTLNIYIIIYINFLSVEIFYYFYVITYDLYCLVHDFIIMFYLY